MEEPLRVRVVFDDRKMLSKSQRSEGLKRCWLLLEPGIATISDLESYVRRSFNLKRSCPHGLVLSMDDFVLPPFESTRVMKDKDIIRVRKKDATQSDDIELGDGRHYIQDSGVLEKQCTVSGDKLLAIREFGEDSGRKRKNDEDLCAHNDNAIHTGCLSKSKKKRKHSDEIQGSKKKKLKTSSKKPKVTGDEVDTVEDDEDNHLGNSLESSQKRDNFLESPSMEDKPCTVNGRPGVASQLEGSVEKVNGSVEREKRRKKPRLISPEKVIIIARGAQNIPTEQNPSSCQKRDNSVECLNKKGKQSHKDGGPDVAFASQPDDDVIKKPSPVLMGKRNLHAEKNIGGNTCEPHENGSVTQVQSRSSRRKKARRQWLREIQSQQGEGQIPPNVIHGESPGQQQETEQNTEVEKEIVPVVIRPGHIRFQPLDEEQIQGHLLETMETLQWNGTTNKKKGQKWGREKNVSNWDDANGYSEQSNGKERNMSKWSDANVSKGQKWGREKIASKWNDANGYKGHKWPREKTMSKGNDGNHYSEQYNGKEKTMNKWNDANASTEECNITASKWNDANGYTEQSNKKTLSEKGQTGSSLVDFESLFPLTRVPQVGDVLAYRLIELSFSWCPEVSSFRVGQVTSYNYLNMGIILVPVPEYPNCSDEDIEQRESMLQSSPYNEDGSLQIHYPSLIDVRLLKSTDLEATTSDFPGGEMIQEAAPVNNWERAAVNSNANHSEREMSTQEIAHVNNLELAVVNSNTKEAVAQPADNGNASGSTWYQIKQALNEMKAELQKKKDGWDEWTPNKSSANTSWSYTALRRSAVGPTLAYLRGRNDKRPHKK